jgi:transposase
VQLVKEETNPEVLRQFSLWLIDENEKLRKDNQRLRDQKAEAAQLKLSMDDKFVTLRKLIFGKSSEKSSSATRRRQDDKDLLLESQSLVPAPKETKTESLPEDVVTHAMSEADLKEESKVRGLSDSNQDWKEIPGLFDESTEVTVIERQYKKIRHRRKKYRYTGSDCPEKEIIVTAPGPEKLLPGCSYSIDFAVQVVVDKFLYHLPLERQLRIMEAGGLGGVFPKTLYNLTLAVGVSLEKIHEKIRKEILECGLVVHCDETPWPIFGKKDDSGYLWVTSNQAGSYYRFEPTRSGSVIEDMLKGYQGPTLSDGYQGYNRLKKLGCTVANCWSHARRKYFDIQENYPTECAEIIELIDKLFEVEHGPKTYEELDEKRKNESASLVKAIKDWCFAKKISVLPQSGLARAIDYTLKYWPGLTVFLENPKIPLSNNDAERALRQGVMGRKNFYGSRSIDSADNAAVFYSVIESCKKVELDPKSYIEMVLRMNTRGEDPPTPLEYARKIRTT